MHDLLRCDERGIEAFHMADLEDDAGPAGEADEFARLTQVVGDGFFDQDVFSLRDRELCDLEMSAGGGLRC